VPVQLIGSTRARSNLFGIVRIGAFGDRQFVGHRDFIIYDSEIVTEGTWEGQGVGYQSRLWLTSDKCRLLLTFDIRSRGAARPRPEQAK
jgi:hypothetical protein